jgi:cell division septation protein DedD
MSDNTKNSFVIDQIQQDDPDLEELKQMKIKLQISKKKKELKKKNFLAKNPVVSKLQSKLDAKSESKPNPEPEPEQPVQKKEPEQPVAEPEPVPEPVKKMPEPEPVMKPVRANSSGKWLVL